MKREKFIESVYSVIGEMVESDSRVLDLGCGSGDFLYSLIKQKNVKGEGIDINEKRILECIKKGISVIQEDMNDSLEKYRNKVYDYVILSQTLQESSRPDFVLSNIVRIGKKAIVSFPNFGYYKTRGHLFFRGSMPKSKVLPYEWYDTPNIHMLTIKDFKEFCKKSRIKIIEEVYLTRDGGKRTFVKGSENLFAEEAIFLIQKR